MGRAAMNWPVYAFFTIISGSIIAQIMLFVSHIYETRSVEQATLKPTNIPSIIPRSSELIPCPFFGSEAKLSLLSYIDRYGWIACTGCSANMWFPVADKDKAVASWNRRETDQNAVS